MNISSFLENPDGGIYNRLPALAVDTETTNLNKGDFRNPDNRLIMVSVFGGGRGRSIRPSDFTLPESLLAAMEGETILVGHNIKFDLAWLARYGLDLRKVLVWDTMIAEKVILGNNPKSLPLNLSSVAQRWGLGEKQDFISGLIKMGNCPSTLPQKWLRRYCEQDTMLAYTIFEKQLAEMNKRDQLGVVLTRCLLTPCLAEIESHGLTIDKERVNAEHDRVAIELRDVERELHQLSPDTNWASPKQVRELVYGTYKFQPPVDYSGRPKLTGSGELPTDKNTLANLKCRTKRQYALVDLLNRRADLAARMSKTLSKLKACADAGDKLYFSFNQHLTATHRLSSNGAFYKIQGQNIPREYKKFFSAESDFFLVEEFDGSGLEFRTAVEMGDDEQGRADLANPDFDPHTHTAQIIFKTEEVSDELRTAAKAHTFKPLYGGMSGTEDEQRYYRSFQERYAGVTAMQKRWKAEVLETGKVRLPWGMEFYFPHSKIQRSGYQTYSTQICNYPVQSLATAEIIPIALVYAWHRMQGMASKIVNTVHDSAATQTAKDEREKVHEIMVDSFTTSVYNYLYHVYGITFRTPLGVGVKSGTHWGQGDEIKIDRENHLV